LIAVYLISLAAGALADDRDQPIQIEAGKLEIDERRQVSIYRDNVHLRQGSLHFQADMITLHFDRDNNLEWLEITGAPASFSQLNENRETISGSAENIKYFQQDTRMELRDNARFVSGQDTIESGYIRIDTQSGAVEAGDTTSKDRVRMLIQPGRPRDPQ
jgi:lipopolysaccharide export system protein LptA